MCYFQEAITALQEDGENYLVEYFQRSQKIAIHAGRKTIQIEDTKVSWSLSFRLWMPIYASLKSFQIEHANVLRG